MWEDDRDAEETAALSALMWAEDKVRSGCQGCDGREHGMEKREQEKRGGER